MSVNDLRPGTTFIYEKNLFVVVEQSFSKTGRQQGKVSVKAKNLRTGARVEITFTGGDKVEKAMIERKDMQYLYNDGNDAYLMDIESYEQIQIPMSRLEWESKFLKDGLMIKMTDFDGEVLGISLPDKVELEVTQAEGAVKGDTTSGAQKKAVLETGHEIMVPLFVNVGTVIIVSTEDGKYSGRAQ
ncbi:elongation factor P [Entomoplasma ellychniae]|uniref:Elongation factor P n=2 Tax=Entomoplasmataceae TaxID=33925 RepID=A0A2S5RG13_9MOLU|nr:MULTISPECIES: elongation factor P [Entomoplasmataceae]PPE04477.1 elongation factor P [Entomoplasma ellychniae]PPE06250.1 elongation factor P [Mesoplasma corruscae]